MPSLKLLKAYGDVAEPLLQKPVANAKEARSLAQTRDFLLSKLMSGEVRLRDADKVVEAAHSAEAPLVIADEAA